MIGKVITLSDRTKWVIFDTWGDQDEYYCVTDFKTQTVNEMLTKNDPNIISIEKYNVEWLFIARREKNLKDLEEFVK